LKYDPSNSNVLRDLGNLQVQLRDFEGYAETRRQLLVGKSSIQQNWVTYAVALYLAKDYKRAIEVLRSFEKTITDDKASEKLKKKDKSELTLLEARNHEAMGNYLKAIECLTSPNAVVVNLVAKNEQLARLHLALGDKDKAIFHYE